MPVTTRQARNGYVIEWRKASTVVLLFVVRDYFAVSDATSLSRKFWISAK